MPDDAANSAATELARELARVRQRGISNLDLSAGGQRPLIAPQLETLARSRATEPDLDRISLIRDLLSEGLDAYAARNVAEAKLIRDLFFDVQGRSPGPGGPRELLHAARQAVGLDEDAFRRRQRQYLETFAAYLLNYRESALTDPHRDVSAESRKGAGALRVALALVVVAGLIGAFFLWRAQSTNGRGQSPGGNSAHTSGPAILFRFDDLGSTTGDIISVYPGVATSSSDRKPNGTYRSGQTAPALCITHGRTINSDPKQGEQARTSDLWVRIQGAPGTVQYATLTYGDLRPVSARLGAC